MKLFKSFALASMAALPVSALAGKPVNFVVIYLDDCGYGDFSCTGALRYKTPNIDQMASNGLQFTQYLAPQPVSGASRAGLLTGCYPNRLGFYGAPAPGSPVCIKESETTLGEMLKGVGYKTAIYGKWHVGDTFAHMPLQNGFDEFFGLLYSNSMGRLHPTRTDFPDLALYDNNEVLQYNADNDMLTTWYTEHAVDFIASNKNKPFFLYVAHSMPHIPLGVSEKFKGKSKQGMYGDVMMEIDWSVGEILKALRKHNLEKRTLVILTSDNGPWLNYGNHGGSTGGLREGKGTTFEGGNRTPCIAYWKGHTPKGAICNELISGIDFFPTFASIAGAQLPPLKIDGVNIRGLIEGSETESPRKEFAYYYKVNNLEAVTDGHFKLIFPHKTRTYELHAPGADGKPGLAPNVKFKETALFDLRRDPGERYNVIDNYPEVVEKLKKIADRYRSTLGDDLTEGCPGPERRL